MLVFVVHPPGRGIIRSRGGPAVPTRIGGTIWTRDQGVVVCKLTRRGGRRQWTLIPSLGRFLAAGKGVLPMRWRVSWKAGRQSRRQIRRNFMSAVDTPGGS